MKTLKETWGKFGKSSIMCYIFYKKINYFKFCENSEKILEIFCKNFKYY